jgi:hypothetical protein
MGLGARLAGAWKELRGGARVKAPENGVATDGAPPSRDATQEEPKPQSARSVWITVVVIGLLSLVLFNMFAQPPLPAPAARSTVLSVTIMLAAAATAIGALLGFLFGIPRSAQETRPAAATTTRGATEEQAAYEQGVYEVNTNLEQISDWLTKILVGVGLIQLGSIAEPLGRLVDSIAGGLGGRPVDRLMVGGILVYFTIYGFLASYLLTRLQLRGAFTRADLSAVVRVATKRASIEFQRQQELDAEAHSMVARTLQPPPGSSPPSQEELNRAVQNASPVVRSQAFSLARHQRLADETSPEGQKNLERTARVFRALAAADPDAHRNHGQLAYALRYAIPPDLEAAERELTAAIDRRGKAGETGYLYYELNRASLQIDKDRRDNITPSSDRKSSILAGLRTAAENPDLLTVIHDDDTIQAWLDQFAPEADFLRQPQSQRLPAQRRR